VVGAREKGVSSLLAKREIPSLDGLRAVSIALVIFSHCAYAMSRLYHGVPVSEISLLGQEGVDVFFVISGFLITHLLLKEFSFTGSISLKRFYLRRFFRIFPAFYVFLLVLGALALAGMISLNTHSYICAATYTYNYCRMSFGWLLGHCWSLSLEEQFYLLWPPCLVLLGKKRSTHLALAIIVLSPVSRGISYFVLPSLRGLEGIMLHTRLDTIMFGCLIALLHEHLTFHRFTARFLQPRLIVVCALLFLVISPLAEARFQAKYSWTVGYTLRGILVSIVLVYAMQNPLSPFGRILNTRVFRHVGVISYSLYLWQQLFTGPNAFWFPLNLIIILVCAEASFFLVERPAFLVRDRLEKTLRGFSLA
jgi:peptidoglycan/LPS O-acetylase OafA/YrhL